MGYSPCGGKESDMTEWLTLSLFASLVLIKNEGKRTEKRQLVIMGGVPAGKSTIVSRKETYIRD